MSDTAKPILTKIDNYATRKSVDVVAQPRLEHRSFKHKQSAASIHSLPLTDVPDRKSSLAHSRQASLQDFPSWRLPPPTAEGKMIPPRGRAESPIKKSIARDGATSDAARPVSERTFIRNRPPIKVLENGNSTHRRLQISTHLNAPLFVGGGTIEGHVSLSIDQADTGREKSRPLLISKLSIDIVGLEELSEGKK